MVRSVTTNKKVQGRFPVPFPAIIAVVSCLCILGLDYLNWRRGEPAVIFPFFFPLKTERIAKPALHEERTSNASRKSQPVLSPGNKEDAPRASSAAKKETAPAQNKSDRSKSRFKYKAAVIIDDIGSSTDVVRFLSDLKTPITVSILPLSTDARESAEIAHGAGLEIMIHIPGESLNHQEAESGDLNGVFIQTGQTPDEVRKIMEDFLASVPYLKGANNHMGSKITQNSTLMREVLAPLKSRRLYFVDSRTSEQSVAANIARKMGIPSAGRDVFLDAVQEEKSIKMRILEMFRLARKKSPVVGIGHPFPETLSALQAMLPLARNYEVELVFVSQIVR